jgi:MerR family transcriptional regulator, light-induced transcriptional regulator
MSYRIKSVAALTGLTTSTLRAWERRYGLVEPQRTRGGYRVYSEDDVARLSRIKSLLDNGFKVSEAISLVEREVPILPRGDASTESLETIREELIQALLQMDRPRASRSAMRLSSLTFERRIDEVLLPAIRTIGSMWVCGEANAAQEHFASAFVREKLIGMLEELDAGPADGPEVVCMGVPGEQHEIGLLAASVYLALRGWRVTYLGPNLPYEDLGAALAARPPRLLCTAIINNGDPVRGREIVNRLQALVPDRTEIIVGGSGIASELGDEQWKGVHLISDLPSFLDSPLLEPTK